MYLFQVRTHTQVNPRDIYEKNLLRSNCIQLGHDLASNSPLILLKIALSLSHLF